MGALNANFNHYGMVDSDLLRELIKLSPHPLENCEYCTVIKRKDSWCWCEPAEEAKAKWELSQRLPLDLSQQRRARTLINPPKARRSK